MKVYELVQKLEAYHYDDEVVIEANDHQYYSVQHVGGIRVEPIKGLPQWSDTIENHDHVVSAILIY